MRYAQRRAALHSGYAPPPGLVAAMNSPSAHAGDQMSPANALLANTMRREKILDAFDDAFDARTMHRDAQAALAFNQSTLAYVIPTVFQKRFGQVRYAQLIPVNNSADRWAESIVYYSTEELGAAKFMSGGAFDVPNVEVDVTQYRQAVRLAAIGYSFSLEEQGQSGRSTVNMLERKTGAAVKAYDQMIDRTSMVGDSTVGFEGLINHSQVTPANVANNQAGTSRLWANKSTAEKLLDLTGCVNAAFSATRENFASNTLLLPPSALAEISSEDKSEQSDRSIKEYVMANHAAADQLGQLQIVPVAALETAGAGGTRRMVAYHRTPEVLELHIPMPFEFLPPHTASALHIEVAGAFRFAGVEVRHPTALTYRDGF